MNDAVKNEFRTLSLQGLNAQVWGRGDEIALVFHGGPGTGLNPRHVEYFNRDRHRVVLFDQRGTGRSGAPGMLASNTAQHTLADAERIRVAMGVDRWIVVGGSWGGALALAYAAAHPNRVRGLVVRSSHISRAAQERWMFTERAERFEVGRIVRDWFLSPLDPIERRDPARAWFARMIAGDTSAVDVTRRVAALEASFHGPQPGPVLKEDAVAPDDVARTRIYLWYWMNNYFLPEVGPAEPEIISRIPHRIIHGSKDLICPVEAARSFAQRGDLRFEEIPDAGHDGLSVAMISALRSALETLCD